MVLLAVGAAAAAAGWYFGPRLRSDSGAGDVAALQAAPFLDLDGRSRSILEWQGRVLVCNFWATWCAPCREEIPALNRIRARLSEKSIEIVGIAIDQAANVANFVKEVRIDYPVVLADHSAIDLMRRLGNPAGGLPFTVVLDREGRLAHRKLGAISEEDFEKRLAAIL